LAKKRIFISFAKEDIQYRDLFCGQKELKDTPFDFVDLSVKEPWDEKWKVGICLTHQTPIPSMRGWKTILGT